MNNPSTRKQSKRQSRAFQRPPEAPQARPNLFYPQGVERGVPEGHKRLYPPGEPGDEEAPAGDPQGGRCGA